MSSIRASEAIVYTPPSSCPAPARSPDVRCPLPHTLLGVGEEGERGVFVMYLSKGTARGEEGKGGGGEGEGKGGEGRGRGGVM